MSPRTIFELDAKQVCRVIPSRDDESCKRIVARTKRMKNLWNSRQAASEIIHWTASTAGKNSRSEDELFKQEKHKAAALFNCWERTTGDRIDRNLENEGVGSV